MMFLTLVSAVLPGQRGYRQPNAAKGRGIDFARLADLLFYRQVGVAGFIGRLSLLAVVAAASYLLGAGVAIVLLKAPVAAALLIGAVLFGWATGETD